MNRNVRNEQLMNRGILILILLGISLLLPQTIVGAEIEKPFGPLESMEGHMLMAQETRLAQLHYVNGVEVVFSYDELVGDFSLEQEGPIGTEPFMRGEEESLLDLFMALTPPDAPVPELLLGEPAAGSELPAELGSRQISPNRVSLDHLELPMRMPAKTHYSWAHWDDGRPGDFPTMEYFSSWFVGKARYTDSYLANYTPRGSASWKWVRHRFYYKLWQTYYLKYEKHVGPWRWHAKTVSGSKLYRKVKYDRNWNDSLSLREGRFRN